MYTQAVAWLSLLTSALALPAGDASTKCDYPGWAGIKYMFIFGDSYTATGFNDTLAQPSKANPFGNPAYPGYTASNGPNWIDFLTTTYNQTFVETVNLAYGGATVDSDLVAPYLPTVLSVKQQVETEYLPMYSKSPSFLPWQSTNTLFGIFIGINDVGNSYYRSNSSAINTASFQVYANLVEELYRSGARNFLFLNVPPTDRSPGTTAQGSYATTTLKADIADWNSRVAALSKNLTSVHKDATSLLFDTNAAFTQVLDNPCSHVETCPYKNTTAYCTDYENGTPSWYTLDADCGIPVDEYFWLNTLHPTFRMHNVTAQLVAKELEAAPKC